MRLFGFAVVLMFLLTKFDFAQTSNKVSDVMYVKAGVEFANYTNTGYKDLYSGPNRWQKCFSGGIGYEYSKTIDMEIEYKYFPEYISETRPEYMYANRNGERYHFYAQTTLRSSIFNFRLNYHVSEDRKTHPIYFIGSVSFAAQPVRNDRTYTYEDRVETTSESYIRYLLGPIAGVGVYFDTGIVSLQSEISFGARISLFKDKGFSEGSFNFSFTPVIHF